MDDPRSSLYIYVQTYLKFSRNYNYIVTRGLACPQTCCPIFFQKTILIAFQKKLSSYSVEMCQNISHSHANLITFFSLFGCFQEVDINRESHQLYRTKMALSIKR